MSLIKRVQLLEKHFGTDDGDTTPEAVLIFTVDASREDTPPLPISKFTSQGREIHRLEDENYADFEARAIRESFEKISIRQPSRRNGPMPGLCLIADGSKQE